MSTGAAVVGTASAVFASCLFLRPKPRLKLGSSRFGSLPLVSGSVGMSGFCHSSTRIQERLSVGAHHWVTRTTAPSGAQPDEAGVEVLLPGSRTDQP